MKRASTIVLVIVLSLGLGRPAFAEELKPSIKKSIADVQASMLATADQARPNAPNQNDDNKYFWPAVLLMSGGGVVALYGMTHDTGIACSSNSTVTSVSCGVTKSKATIFTGIGMVGVGAFLFYKASTVQPSSLVRGW